jgi:hypothetical protein
MDSFPDPTKLTVSELEELIDRLSLTEQESEYERQVTLRKISILREELERRRGETHGS